MEAGRIGAIVLAGSSKGARQLRWKRRVGLLGRVLGWRGDSKGWMENRITSWINKDDYIYGENKALLYLHPDLVRGPNMNFFKTTIHFARGSGNKIYRRRRDELLGFLSKGGKTSLEMVLNALKGSRTIDRSRIVLVGPLGPVRHMLERTGFGKVMMIKQGTSLGDNIRLGMEALSGSGYDQDFVLVLGADMPLLQPEQVDGFLEASIRRGGSPHMFYGMSSRRDLGPMLRDLGVENLGKVGPNRPAKGNLQKFGIPFMDDLGLFGAKGSMVDLMNANLLLYRVDTVDSKVVDRLYSMRKMFSNPLIYPKLVYHFGPHLLQLVRRRLPISEAERLFSGMTGLDLRVVPSHPLLALDLDSFTDLRRASAIVFGKDRSESSLETDFRKYIKDLRRTRRLRHRSGEK